MAHASAILSRGDFATAAEALTAKMTAAGVSRLMVHSDNPFDILRAIDAANRTGADLFIAHTNLPETHIDAVVKKFGVQMIVAANDRATEESAVGAASGLIYMMTSGTTGAPKIASHSLNALMSRAKAAMHPGNRGAKWLLTYQPTGFAGVQVQLTAVVGRGVVVAPEQRTPAGFLEAAKANGVTQISATPTFWRAFLMVIRPGDLNLRQITLGGEAADQSTLDRIKKAFPEARVTHIYASTEAGVVFSVHDGREGFPAEWLETETQGVTMRVSDGFLHIRTPNAMGGYVSDTAQPKLDDGWLATADRVEIRGDRAFIVGRDDSTINVAGSKVYPLMVEQFLLRQAGVIEAHVYGVSNPISGQLVAADVVIEPGLDPAATRSAILAACRENLAQYQVPRAFKVVDAIAVRESGKKG
ncbi:AMP-binding domain protein [Hyphomonas neptunium ATCC 15444]|uniref:AMP-binding domain protein n=1 Tax=Hyphomonas neptunium (strain ATCC 15444) TaxID=228405 RepID=Q0C0H0_HYPNA|nr:AMP-binding domain protein [Hyphomonas neptunium ATCC 15444]